MLLKNQPAKFISIQGLSLDFKNACPKQHFQNACPSTFCYSSTSTYTNYIEWANVLKGEFTLQPCHGLLEKYLVISP